MAIRHGREPTHLLRLPVRPEPLELRCDEPVDVRGRVVRGVDGLRAVAEREVVAVDLGGGGAREVVCGSDGVVADV